MERQFRRRRRTNDRPLADYLNLQYPFQALVDPDDGGYVIVFPDLPGCLTQTDSIEDIPAMAEEARLIWIETEYGQGGEIPLPTYPEEYSGKFNVRLPRSLHRELAESAEREGVSLNQHVVALLSGGDVAARTERKLDDVIAQLSARRGGTVRVADDRAQYTATPPARRRAADQRPSSASRPRRTAPREPKTL